MISMFDPYLMGNERKYLLECIDTNWISSQGRFVKRFEQALANYHGMKHAIATSSCTTALHLSLKALGIGSNDEVICPDLTFIAPANMIVLSGAKLVLVDVDPETLTINPDLIEERITNTTKAIMVVHQFGHAAHMDEILSIAKKYNLKVIEDNAESIGAKYKGKLLGTLGHISTFSFFANKIITSGEGGAILSNNDDLANRCHILRDHGMSLKERYHHVDLGYNYRLTNLQAAVGLAQLEKLNEILELRRCQMEHYNKLLSDIEGVYCRSFKEWCTPVHWLMTITLDKKYHRNDFLKYMYEQGVDCRQMINPVHRADHFIHYFKNQAFPNAMAISEQSVHLPSATSLTMDKIGFIADKVKQFCSNGKLP